MEPVGSTCTLVAKKFQQAGIDPSPGIALCMASGMISDTLHLRSPTTTQTDRDTLEWLQQAKFHYPLLALTHPGNLNQGRSATRNLALPHLRGTYTLFLDSDMEATPDLFRAHLEVLEQGDSVSIGTVSYRNRKVSHHSKNLYTQKFTGHRQFGTEKDDNGHRNTRNFTTSSFCSKYKIELKFKKKIPIRNSNEQ